MAGAIIFGGFLVLWGMIWFFAAPRAGDEWGHYVDEFSDDPAERAGTARVTVTRRQAALWRLAGLVAVLLGAGVLLSAFGVLAEKLLTAVFVIGLGLAALAGALWSWTARRRIADAAARSSGDQSDGIGTAIAEGPVEALTQTFWRAVPPNLLGPLSALVLAVFGATCIVLVVTGVDVARAGEIAVVPLDVIELLWYGLLAVGVVVLVLMSIFTGDGELAIGAAGMLVLLGISIGLGLWLGLLDGWIDILRWLGDRF